MKIKGIDKDRPKVGLPIEFKTDSIDEENWTIEGYASTKELDTYRDIVLPEAFKKHLPRYKRNPMVCFMHDFADPIGKVTDVKIDEFGLWVKVQISKTASKVWTLISEGILKAFSFSWSWENWKKDVEYDEDEDIRYIKNVILLEVSVVSVPANPAALFEMAMAKGIQVSDELKSSIERSDEEIAADLKFAKRVDQKITAGEKLTEEMKSKSKTKEVAVPPDIQFTEEDRETLEGAKKSLKDIQEVVKNAVTKDELKETVEKVQADALKSVKTLQKERRKLQFEGELEADAFYGIDPMKHPRVFMAKTPREKFAALLDVSTSNSKVTDLQSAADDLLLTHILMKKFGAGYGGVKSLKMFDRWASISEDFRKALDTATAGEGAEWIPTGFSADLIDKMRLQLNVAALFQRFTMPTSPYKYPLLTGDVTVYFVPESLHDLSPKIPKSNITTAGLTFTAKKLAASVVASDELTEDSIVAILPILKADLARGMAQGLEDVVVNGDTTATHQDSDVTASNDRRKAFNGLRDLTNAGAKYDASTWAAAAIRAYRKLMGKYGVSPADLAHVVGISGYIQMLGFTEVATVDKFGEAATWLKGFLTALDGSPIVISEFIREDLNATGVYDGVTETMTISLLVHRPSILIGERRVITIKSKEEIETDQEILVITQRVDMQKKYPSADNCIAMGYKITA